MAGDLSITCRVPDGFTAELEWHDDRGHDLRLLRARKGSLVLRVRCSCGILLMGLLEIVG